MALTLPHSADDWIIASAMIHRPNLQPDGTFVQDQSPDAWRGPLAEVAVAGFTHLDVTDSFIRLADLDRSRLEDFMGVAHEVGLQVPAISTSRRNLIDPQTGEENLAYCHRVLDTAAAIGARYVSFGLFGPLTDAQKKALWFWTVPGVTNPDDPAVWRLAVSRLRELGRHAAELGIQASLEMYEDTYLGTADDAVRLVTDIDLPNVKINADLGNLLRMHRPVEHWQSMMEKVAPFAGYWHAKNYFRLEDETTGQVMSSPAPLELGVMNYRAAIRMALKAGFDSPFLLEHYGGDGLSVCATNREYLRRILRAMEVSG